MSNEEVTITENKAINAKSGANFKQVCLEQASLVKTNMVTKINKILEKDGPVVLVRGLEAVVALMRNVEKATNIDVELYFRDFKKLQLKMQRMDPLAVDLEIAKSKKKELLEIKN